jgi:RNA polymerase sigma-70 factor (ECF subfamily)
MDWSRIPDEVLLRRASADPEGFGKFYERHERAVLGYFMRATGRADLAVDLAAETFARAFQARDDFDPVRGAATGWLLGIARHVLLSSIRRRRVESSARAQLGMARLTLDERLVAAVEDAVLSAAHDVERWLAQLPEDQRAAVRARVLDERSYGDIARELQCSEAVVRQRVSRGLSALRKELEGLA